MQIITRYILTQVAIGRDKKLIPFWDENLVFEKTEMYGKVIRYKNDREELQIIEALYDLKTKTLSLGIEINYYPPTNDLEFKINDNVLYESGGYRNLVEGKIVSIEYDSFSISVSKGKKITEKITDVVIEDDLLYCVKHWKPVYVLDTGFKTEWTHQLYHKGF